MVTAYQIVRQAVIDFHLPHLKLPGVPDVVHQRLVLWVQEREGQQVPSG
jgi:hypothetical protein